MSRRKRTLILTLSCARCIRSLSRLGIPAYRQEFMIVSGKRLLLLTGLIVLAIGAFFFMLRFQSPPEPRVPVPRQFTDAVRAALDAEKNGHGPRLARTDCVPLLTGRINELVGLRITPSDRSRRFGACT